MEIKNLTFDNLKDIIEPCICREWTKRLAKNTGVSIKRVRESLYRGAKLKVNWIEKRLKLGYNAKILYEKENPIGFIDYLPVETQTEITGKDIVLINCVSIMPNFRYRGKGYGKLLLEEVELNAKKLSKGIAVVAHNHPKWMPYSFFEKFGYKKVGERGSEIKDVLMFKEFKSAEIPRFKPRYEYKSKIPSGKILVEIFWSGVCPHNVLSVELFKDTLKIFKDVVIIKELFSNELEEKVIQKYAHGYGVFINGKEESWLLGASKDEILRRMKLECEKCRDKF